MGRQVLDEEDPFATPLKQLEQPTQRMLREVQVTTIPLTDLTEMIRRVAEIEDELERRGADPLIDEMSDLKKIIKEVMLVKGIDEAFDEISEYEAVIQQRSSETWHESALKDILNPSQRKRYLVIRESVDTVAVAEGIKNGDLSRAELEYKGAVTREPGAKALYVRKRKEEK